MSQESPVPSRPRWWLNGLFVIIFVVPGMLGFCFKFSELLSLVQGDAEGAFAIAPITNYLLASSGFLFLLGWAAMNGMFHDIERPKYTMLEREAQLKDH